MIDRTFYWILNHMIHIKLLSHAPSLSGHKQLNIKQYFRGFQQLPSIFTCPDIHIPPTWGREPLVAKASNVSGAGGPYAHHLNPT